MKVFKTILVISCAMTSIFSAPSKRYLEDILGELDEIKASIRDDSTPNSYSLDFPPQLDHTKSKATKATKEGANEIHSNNIDNDSNNNMARNQPGYQFYEGSLNREQYMNQRQHSRNDRRSSNDNQEMNRKSHQTDGTNKEETHVGRYYDAKKNKNTKEKAQETNEQLANGGFEAENDNSMKQKTKFDKFENAGRHEENDSKNKYTQHEYQNHYRNQNTHSNGYEQNEPLFTRHGQHRYENQHGHESYFQNRQSNDNPEQNQYHNRNEMENGFHHGRHQNRQGFHGNNAYENHPNNYQHDNRNHHQGYHRRYENRHQQNQNTGNFHHDRYNGRQYDELYYY